MKCVPMTGKITLQLRRLNAMVRFNRMAYSAPGNLARRAVFKLGCAGMALICLVGYMHAAPLTMTKLVTVPSGTIVTGDGVVVVNWTGGTGPFQVQSRNGLTGAWQDVAGTTTNFSQTNVLTAPMSFYRVLDVSTATKTQDSKAPSVPTGLAATLTGGSQVNLTWNASTDPNPNPTGVKGYNVYRNGYFLNQVAAPNTSMTDTSLSTLTTYSYAVSAVDNNYNESAKSTPVTISSMPVYVDTNTPTVSLTAPTGGSTVSGTISVSAAASDNVGVSRVEFYRDGSTLVGISTGSPYSVSDATTGVANGSHSYTAKAFDAAGNSTTSASVSVTVNNTTTGTPGQLQWVKSMVTPNGYNAEACSVVADSSGNVIVGGNFVYGVDFGSGNSYSLNNGIGGVFIGKYSATGSVIWTKAFSAGTSSSANSVAVDSQNNVFVAGSFGGTVDFGGVTLTASNQLSMFVAKYSPSGTLLWARAFGGAGIVYDYGNALAVDGSDNVFMLGRLQSANANFGNGITLSANGSSLSLVKLSSTGTTLWAKVYGTGAVVPKNLAINGSGDVVVTGQFGTV
jgi:hypothetical protein